MAHTALCCSIWSNNNILAHTILCCSLVKTTTFWPTPLCAAMFGQNNNILVHTTLCCSLVKTKTFRHTPLGASMFGQNNNILADIALCVLQCLVKTTTFWPTPLYAAMFGQNNNILAHTALCCNVWSKQQHSDPHRSVLQFSQNQHGSDPPPSLFPQSIPVIFSKMKGQRFYYNAWFQTKLGNGNCGGPTLSTPKGW